ncbi:unnamed protein product [Angiostrongylus costaricensis]|uniref:Miro domain-containing protein n=1 Tax=Angiostrongylus costaricensis TaxID=334426 RepID=A0A0R3PYA0_ANGCS|nr:unnamed protein product [Angiostrongylus costaricensis]
MTSLTDVDLVRCIVIGDEKSGKELMMMKYASFTGVRYNAERKEIVTAFNGSECVIVDSPRIIDTDADEPHVFLLCVSVASRTSLEEAVTMVCSIFEDFPLIVPFVLIGTQIDKRLSMCVENYGSGETKYLPVPLNQAESFAKRIGASEYLECSEVTGVGLDDVFESAFEIGHNYALERIRGLRRKISHPR